ncbi:hypothetical protein Tco_0937095 [Tanacetum coccineum]|uniref:Uncharacterized protein n=1 Tax=Tanacetum coccineum TaxID=301880 RepID=A0ABQ5DD91_9ASTR
MIFLDDLRIHMEARMFAQLGYRKKKWGVRMNEGLWVLFIGKGPLKAKVSLKYDLGHMEHLEAAAIGSKGEMWLQFGRKKCCSRSLLDFQEHSVDPESEISRVPQEVYVSTPIITNEKDQETPKVNRKNWNAMMERELGEEPQMARRRTRGVENESTGFVNISSNTLGGPEKQYEDLNTDRNLIMTNINYVRPRVNTVNSNVNTVRSRQPHKVLFTETECLVVSSDFKMPDENQILLKLLPCDTMDCTDLVGYSFLPLRETSGFYRTFIRQIENQLNHRWMFNIDYLTDSMNYIPVSLDNQSNPRVGTSEVTNSACTLQSSNANASEEADEDEELINFQKPSNTSEKEAFSTGISEHTHEILAFRRRLGSTCSNAFIGKVKQKTDGLFISQDKYVAEMLKKFDLASVKTAITPMETKMALTKDEEADDVDVHLYRSMIGSLMYLTASRPDIMFAVCACSRFQVTPKTSHLNAVKRIFKYLKGKPNLGLWYPRESTFDLEAYSDSDYAGANLDRKSTTGGCQFLGRRLISWQCKKQTIVATSTTEAEYVAAASCCGQVLWIQNQMLDYGFNFMNTKIHIDNESTICIVKNPVYHSKTKHIEIRHHFIRDSYEKKLIRVEKIHTDFNVADLLTKAFDGPRFNFLVVNIDVSIGFEDVSIGFTDIKFASEKISSGGEHVSASQREGKAVLEETPQTKRTKNKSEKIRTSGQKCKKYKQKRKEWLKCQRGALVYTKDWDTIRAKLEANADLVKEIAGEDVSEADYAQRMVGLISQRRKLIAEQKAKAQRDKPMTQSSAKTYMHGKFVPVDTEKEVGDKNWCRASKTGIFKKLSLYKEDVSVLKRRALKSQ